MRAAPLIAGSSVVFTSLAAAAQVCEPGWQPGFAWDPPAEASHAIVAAAPRGGREIIFVGGEFTRSVLGEPLSRIASFDGERWDDLQGGVDGAVRALVAWDPDGAGPQRELVVAAGEFTMAGLAAPGGPVTAPGVAAWDGESWRPLGDGLPDSVAGLAVLDFNGDGVDDLFATSFNGATAATWRFLGGSWSRIDGPAPTFAPHLLEPWDRDGAGAEPAWLAIIRGPDVHLWRGSQREQLPPAPWPITAAAAFDRDGAGPLPPSLFVATHLGTVRRLYSFEDSAWNDLGSLESEGNVLDLEVIDPDGPGPESEGLYFVRHQIDHWWRFATLTRWPEWTDRAYTGGVEIRPELVGGIALWQSSPERQPEFWLARATPDAPAQPGSVTRILNEPDVEWAGTGPLWNAPISLAQVPGYELISHAGRSLLRYDAQREVWVTWATVDGGNIEAVVTQDERRLFIAGWFESVNGEPMRGVAVWEDGQWRQMGEGFGSVSTLAFADLGKGEQLYAGGRQVTSAGGAGIVTWDGARWQDVALADRTVTGFTVHDFDGAGPAPPELVAIGVFRTIGGVEAPWIAAFDGETWRPLGDQFVDYVHQIASHDPDGAGPQPPNLYTDYRGQLWQYVQGEWVVAVDDVGQILVFDPDGDGPQPPDLFVAGTFETFAGLDIPLLARLHDGEWTEVGGGLQRWCPMRILCQNVSIGAATLLREGRPQPALTFTGPILRAGDQPSFGVALWISDCPCAADCDGDGELTFMDLLCFQGLFSAADPAADCDGDTQFTFFDFLCFQNAFAAGCP